MADERSELLSRRRLLRLVAGLGGFALSGTSGSSIAQEATRLFTPPLTSGPFYPEVKPLDQDGDLTVVAGKEGRAQGTVIHLTGRVMNAKGEPVGNAELELWQADAGGRYAHAGDSNPGPRDPNFQGYGFQKTDAEGRYRFKTIKPGAYPGPMAGMRTPHIHFEVRGKVGRVVTQLFFPDEPLNARDAIFRSIKGSQRDALIARLVPPTREMESDSIHATWDVVLLKG